MNFWDSYSINSTLQRIQNQIYDSLKVNDFQTVPPGLTRFKSIQYNQGYLTNVENTFNSTPNLDYTLINKHKLITLV